MGKPFLPKKRVLSLRPEHRKTAEVSIQSRDTINQFVKKTKNPFGEPRVLEKGEVKEVETTLRKLEKELLERERIVQETEARLVEKERELWEAEALLDAKMRLLQSQQDGGGTPLTEASRSALEELQSKLDAQEKSIAESKALMHEREAFVEEAEARLFEKTMEQQEQEAELEMRFEELDLRGRELDAREGITRPEEPREVLE